MKVKIIMGLSLFCLAHPGTFYGQQAQGQEKPALVGQSTQDTPSYMSGKDHYLPDSPSYMSGKKHYLQGRPPSKTDQSSQDSQASVSKEGEARGGSQNLEKQERIPFQFEFTKDPDNSDVF